jgi:hypothetical protein
MQATKRLEEQGLGPPHQLVAVGGGAQEQVMAPRPAGAQDQAEMLFQESPSWVATTGHREEAPLQAVRQIDLRLHERLMALASSHQEPRVAVFQTWVCLRTNRSTRPIST